MEVNEKQLSDLLVANDDFDQLERQLDVFCPFEAIGMVRQEIRHGHFLSYIFNPSSPHGFGDRAIKALMAASARSNEGAKGGLSLLDIHLMDFDDAIVRREWRNIDILIEVPVHRLVITVELKLDSSEHGGQLSRYRDIVAKEWQGWQHLFLFLTKRGDEPSDEGGAGWLPVHMEAFCGELRGLCREQAGATEARRLLESYLAMIGRHHLTNEELESLAQRIWNKHSAALNFLADRRPDAIGALFQQLVGESSEIANEISQESSIEVIVDSSSRASLQFAISGWDAIPGFLSAEGFTPSNRLILLQVVKAGDDYLRCYFQLGRGDQSMRHKLFHTLREAGADVGKKANPTKEWNRLASIRISLPDLETGSDIDKDVAKVRSKVLEFAVKHLLPYEKALSKLYM